MISFRAELPATVGSLAAFLLFAAASPRLTSSLPESRHTATIRGRITDSHDLQPLSGVNVYLANTTLGTVSGPNGDYRLEGIPPGAYTLVLSRVGYERQVRSILLNRSDSSDWNAQLTEVPVPSRGVEVRGRVPEDWKENLERFTKAFIGGDAGCRIVNPEVLNFRYDHDSLSATSDSVIRIENRVLGYYLRVVLADFFWNPAGDYGHYVIYPLFEPLRPENNRETGEWKENRLKAYTGSMRHFLHSLIVRDTQAELFTIYSGRLTSLLRGEGHPVNAAELELQPEEGTPFVRLVFPGALRVEYGRRADEVSPETGKYRGRQIRLVGVPDLKAVSILQLKSPFALIDSSGNLLNPRSIELSGGWANSRVSELLPLY